MAASNGVAPLTAKVSPPRLRAPRLRDEQLARLAEASEAGLLLVTAPAGYGKTTLLAAGAEALGWELVWYRLDRLDADPRLFLGALARAVHERLPASHEQPASGPDASSEALLMQLAGALERVPEDGLFIVLDEYEAVAEAADFNGVLAALLEYLPPAVHLVLSGRARPRFPTSKLALDDRLVTLTHEDLRLDAGQTAAVLESQSGRAPTPVLVDKVLALTEGWAAGVVLAGRVVRDQSATAEEALADEDLLAAVTPYLSEQVCAQRSPEEQALLRATCCLDSMTTALVEKMAHSPHANGVLDGLAADTAFTFAGPERGTYRYHPLLRRYVQRRLALEEGEEGLRSLQRETAEILVAADHLAEAVELYLAAGTPEPTLDLLRQRGDVLDLCGEVLISRWADALAAEEGPATAWASLLEGHRLRRRNSMADSLQHLLVALSSFETDEDGIYRTRLELATRAYYIEQDDEAVIHLREALRLALNDARQAECYEMLAFVLSSACRWDDLDDAMVAFEDSRGASSERLATKLALLEAQSAFHRGDVHLALETGEGVLARIRNHTAKGSTAAYIHLLAVMSQALARYERAWQFVEESRQICDIYRLPRERAELEVSRGSLLIQEGRLDEGLGVFDEAVASPLLASPPVQVELHLRRGVALRRAGSLGLAAQSFERALRNLSGRKSPLDSGYLRLEQAFTEGLEGVGADAPSRIREVMGEAERLRLSFHRARGEFYLGVLAARRGEDGAPMLSSSCAELLRLGQLDFLGQELVANAEAAQWLKTAALPDETVGALLETVALQAGGPKLLASYAARDDRLGALVMATAGSDLPARQVSRLLQALLRHPSRLVRDRARAMVEGTGPAGERLFPELTAREEEVLGVLAGGRSNEEIGERLFLAVPTVKTHIHHILTKTGSRGRFAAAIVYRQRAAAAQERAAADASAPGAGRD